MCIDSGHVIVKEVEVKVAEIEGNPTEEEAEDLQANEAIVPV